MKLDQLFSKQSLILAAIIVSGLVFALLKLNGTPVDQALWAEDGTIFINQARELGISSLWVSYAGYFHFYPRLVAWLSCLFDLQATPFIFLAGWFVAYMSLIFIAANRALQYKIPPVWAGLLIILMLAQPHSGEVFFTLTNAQWLIGGALALYLLVPIKNKPSIFEQGLLLVASLTGPFALLLSPILLIQFIIYKNWNERKSIYILVGLGAIVQISAILLSNRLTNGIGFDKNIAHWLSAFFTFMSFGSKTAVIKAASILFWATMIYAFVCNPDKSLNHDYHATKGISLSLLVAALLFYGGGLLTYKDDPNFMNPLNVTTARYFFIPYLLIFFASGLMALKQSVLKYIIYGALTVLAASSFSVFHSENLQFKAYAEFAKIKSGTIIPINPQWEEKSPSWYIRLADDTSQTVVPISLNLAEAKIVYINNSTEKTEGNPQVIFNIENKCSDSRYLGMEIHSSLPDNSWVQLLWGASDNFSGQQSLRRYYPAGDAVIQFALPRDNVKYLLFGSMKQLSQNFDVSAVYLYCLGKF